MSEVKRQSEKRATRPYRQTARAAKTAATRRRIVEAAVELHSSVGPADTSLSAVARRAGVSRPTLYAHFPDEAALFQACTLHQMAQDPPPDPTAWTAIDHPDERLRTALDELYAHYARNRDMLENVLRDMHVVESMRAFNLPLVERAFAHMTEVLASAYGDRGAAARQRAGLVAVALSFDTWRTLTVTHGLDARAASRLMARAVRAGVGGTD